MKLPSPLFARLLVPCQPRPMAEMPSSLSGYSHVPWSRCIPSLVAAQAVASGVAFPSPWLVTPKLEPEANPLMG